MSSALTDILLTYIRPFQVVERKLTRAPSDRRAAAYLFAGCIVYLAATMPHLIRENLSHRPDIPLVALVSGAILGGIILLPLAFYFLAAVAKVLLWTLGWRVSWLHSRISLFWANLAAAPLALIIGISEGFFGRSELHVALSWIALGILISFWAIGLYISGRLD